MKGRYASHRDAIACGTLADPGIFLGEQALSIEPEGGVMELRGWIACAGRRFHGHKGETAAIRREGEAVEKDDGMAGNGSALAHQGRGAAASGEYGVPTILAKANAGGDRGRQRGSEGRSRGFPAGTHRQLPRASAFEMKNGIAP